MFQPHSNAMCAELQLELKGCSSSRGVELIQDLPHMPHSLRLATLPVSSCKFIFYFFYPMQNELPVFPRLCFSVSCIIPRNLTERGWSTDTKNNALKGKTIAAGTM